MREAGITVVLTILAVGVLCAMGVLGLALMASCTNVSVTAFVWPTKVSCTQAPPPNVVLAVDGVLARDGLADSLSADSVTALENIAREVGAEHVVCALAQLAEAYRNPSSGAEPSRENIARASRAEWFVFDRHIEVSRERSPNGAPTNFGGAA